MQTKTLRYVVLALCLLSLMPLASAQSASRILGIHLEPCTQGHSEASAECGTFGVYEDRKARSGRIIALRLVVIKAKHPTQRAIAVIAGGPGEGAVFFAGLIADGVFEKYVNQLRNTYDVVFVDNRGMGNSNPSRCDFAPAADPESYFRQLWPDAILSACRQEYRRRANLNFYNTNSAVDDLDNVRAALRYPKLVLDGGSYGTFFSLVYMRRHPQSVESAVLDGVAPPYFLPLPGEPGGAQTALDDLADKCRHDTSCRKHFPQFAQHFNALVQRFDNGPITLKVKNKRLKHSQTVRLSKEVFVDHLRQVLYTPGTASAVPYVVERAYNGDYVPLGKVIDIVAREFAQALDMGGFLSYTCSEEIPFLSEREVRAAAAHSFAKDLRIRAQRRACSLWNVHAMPASFNQPVRSNAPALLLSGSDDPATPPKYAARELPYLPNAKIVLVRGAGHGVENPCTDRLLVRFVRAGSAKGLDVTKCSASFTPPHFDTSMKGWPDL